MLLYFKGYLWQKILIDLFINWGCLLQFVWTTNYCFVLNYFQWRYLLMFTKFIFCINRTEFTTSLSWKIDSAYISKSASQWMNSILQSSGRSLEHLFVKKIWNPLTVCVSVLLFCVPDRAVTYTSKFVSYYFVCS